MAASSVSGMNSWGLYISASVALVMLFSPLLAGVSNDARESADWRNVDGVRAVIDSLRPGVTVALTYGSSTFSDDVSLGGHLVACHAGNGTVSMAVIWALPNITLSPSSLYHLTLDLGKVTVTKTV